MPQRLILIFISTFLAFSAPCYGTIYYVSPTGSFSSSGTSMSSPTTISKINTDAFNAGDSILLQGGATFGGTTGTSLNLNNASDAGTAANPVNISTYGTGSATINAGTNIGIYSGTGIGGFSISNLNIVGQGTSTNFSGINFANPGNSAASGITINNVQISGFNNGIQIGNSGSGTAGYSNVSITNSTVSNNLYDGIFFGGPTFNSNSPNYANSNVYIGHVTADNNPGVAGLSNGTVSGNGIVLGSVSNAEVERCVVYNNGSLNNYTSGPVGIETFNATKVLIQYNESHNIGTGNTDGDGFDLDENTTNSTLQYNYSHDNAGAPATSFTRRLDDQHRQHHPLQHRAEQRPEKPHLGRNLRGRCDQRALHLQQRCL